jgi:hypothetical protein
LIALSFNSSNSPDFASKIVLYFDSAISSIPPASKKRERILLALYDIKFQVKMLPKNECCRFLVSDFIDKFFSVFIAEKKVFLSGG